MPRHPLRTRVPDGWLAGLALVLWMPGAAAAASDVAQADWLRCRQLVDARERLSCFDRVAERLPVPAEVTDPASPAPGGATATVPALQPAEQLGLLSRRGIWSTLWELEPADKHGTFTFKTYRPNFILPLNWTSRINQSPSSPTRAGATDLPHYQRAEVKMQLSVRTKLIQDAGFPDGDLWFGYTQQSQWQLWNKGESSPFRNTDHEAELIYVAPVAQRWQSILPGGWLWKLAQVGLAHQSNGQVESLSRSWNRVYLGVAAERGPWSLQAHWHHRLQEDPAQDDNPDLTRYLGQGDVSLGWFPGRATVQLQWRPVFGQLERGSWQVNATYPVRAEQPQGLRWYAQWFTGYGASLLDYNLRQTSIGLGVSLFEF